MIWWGFNITNNQYEVISILLSFFSLACGMFFLVLYKKQKFPKKKNSLLRPIVLIATGIIFFPYLYVFQLFK